jgi:hypothetical protein
MMALSYALREGFITLIRLPDGKFTWNISNPTSIPYKVVVSKLKAWIVGQGELLAIDKKLLDTYGTAAENIVPHFENVLNEIGALPPATGIVDIYKQIGPVGDAYKKWIEENDAWMKQFDDGSDKWWKDDGDKP